MMPTLISISSCRSPSRLTLVNRTCCLPYVSCVSLGISFLYYAVGQSQFGDLADFLDGDVDLARPIMLQSVWKRRQDRVFPVLAGADHERKSKALAINIVVRI